MENKITNHQAILLMTNTVVATAILFLPINLMERASQDAWISSILLFVSALVFSLIYSNLVKKMKKKDLITFSREVFGRVISFFLELNLVLYLVMITGIIIREISELMVAIYYPTTPLWFFNITLILTAILFVNQGLDVIARSIEIFFYIFLTLFILSIVFLIKDMSFEFLQPILARGIKPVLSGVYPGLLFYSELFLILIIAPQLKNQDNTYKILFISSVVITIILLISIITVLMIFGVDMGNRLTFPLLAAMRYAEVQLIERLDPFYIFFWVGGGLLKITIFVYSAVFVSKKILNISLYKKLIIPVVLGGIYYFSHYFFDNIIEVFDYLITIIPYFLIVQIVYPLLLLVVSSLRGVNYNEK